MNHIASAFIIGCGATAATDAWALLRSRAFGVAAPNWALVGRWISRMPRGEFRHASIAAVPPARAELLVGWIAHYLIGITFAALLLTIAGSSWTARPSLVPALLLGIATVLAPFLILQPGMGAGIAASRTPRPSAARLQSLLTHTVFGLGLYAAGWINSSLNPWSLS